MRLTLLTILLAASASAQTAPLWRAPAWRASAGAGLTADRRSGALSLGIERELWGPLAVGARGAAHTGLVFGTDTFEPANLRWTAEAIASGTARLGRVDLRAVAGVGAASVGYPVVNFVAPDPLALGPARRHFVEEFVSAGVGADLYLAPGVGVGAEVRLVSSLGQPTASEASLGLRIRLPQSQ